MTRAEQLLETTRISNGIAQLTEDSDFCAALLAMMINLQAMLEACDRLAPPPEVRAAYEELLGHLQRATPALAVAMRKPKAK